MRPPDQEKLPLPTGEHLLRRQIPVFVPCFNNLTYLKGMVDQLIRLTMSNVTIVDNGSSFSPLLAYLESMAGEVAVVRLSENKGPRFVFTDRHHYTSLPNYFCLTDPDLEFNRHLPDDFLTRLVDLTEQYRVGKAGFSLDISEPEKMVNEELKIGRMKYKIWEWETQFWKNPLPWDDGDDKAYRASIDTTFAVYNKKFFDPNSPFDGIRVSGRYTCRHLPWYVDTRLPADEEAHYEKDNRFSNYLRR
jgi:hypothetical protein